LAAYASEAVVTMAKTAAKAERRLIMVGSGVVVLRWNEL
jgi:hypothetical protein